LQLSAFANLNTVRVNRPQVVPMPGAILVCF
jgi:hypothetical protein